MLKNVFQKPSSFFRKSFEHIHAFWPDSLPKYFIYLFLIFLLFVFFLFLLVLYLSKIGYYWIESLEKAIFRKSTIFRQNLTFFSKLHGAFLGTPLNSVSGRSWKYFSKLEVLKKCITNPSCLARKSSRKLKFSAREPLQIFHNF